MSEYPKFKYHKTEAAKIVAGKAEEEALGKEWFDSRPEAKAGKKKEVVEVSKPVGAEVNTEYLDALQKQVEELATANAELEAKLEEAEDFIETLQAQLEEAQKNDQRGDDGKFVSPDSESESDGEGEIVEIEASDAAVKLAAEHGIDLATVTGTGANGNITKGDVQKLLDQAAEGSENDEPEGETETEE